MKRRHPKQMSESFLTAAFLSLSGGLQDAYTYIYRGHVFANAQTGNIVLLSQSIAERNWTQTLEYLIPFFFRVRHRGSGAASFPLPKHYQNSLAAARPAL